MISACNYGDSYQVTDLAPALVSRFNIYELDPSVQEWLEWGKKSGIDERILSFHILIKWLESVIVKNSFPQEEPLAFIAIDEIIREYVVKHKKSL